MSTQAIDATDAKAGIAVGFSGAIVALAVDSAGAHLVGLGVVAATVAAVLGAAGLLRTKYDRLSPTDSQEVWLREPHDVALGEMMRTETDIIQSLGRISRTKVRLMKCSWLALLVSVILLALTTMMPLLEELVVW